MSNLADFRQVLITIPDLGLVKKIKRGKTEITCKKERMNAKMLAMKGKEMNLEGNRLCNSNEKNYFDFAQFGAAIKYYGNALALGLGDTLKGRYDSIGLMIGGKGLIGALKGGKFKDKLDIISNIVDIKYTTESIYDFWHEVFTFNLGKR